MAEFDFDGIRYIKSFRKRKMKKRSEIHLQRLTTEANTPPFMAVIYGIYKFFDLGFSLDNYLYTYVPLFGGLLSVILILLFSSTLPRKEPQKKSWSLMLISLGGYVPYIFSIYLMGFLGGYTLWELFSNFSFWDLLFGVVWIFIGYRMLYAFWIMTEMGLSEKDKIIDV